VAKAVACGIERFVNKRCWMKREDQAILVVAARAATAVGGGEGGMACGGGEKLSANRAAVLNNGSEGINSVSAAAHSWLSRRYGMQQHSSAGSAGAGACLVATAAL